VVEPDVEEGVVEMEEELGVVDEKEEETEVKVMKR
jgi:hypothetical protein